MPVVDSRLGIYVPDGKPDRVCEWRGCDSETGYSGRKMKVCSRCTSVRYCSKNCQRQDWTFHKTICRNPPILDLGGWMRAYEWLFKWAAMEALEVHTDPTKILDNFLLINIIRGDEIAGPMPSPFLVESACVMGNAGASELGPGSSEMIPGFNFADSNRPASEDIRREGGMGQALVLFVCATRTRGPGQNICMLERYPLYEEPLGAESGYRHMAMWEGVLKGVANGGITVSDISRMIEPPSSDAGSTAD